MNWILLGKICTVAIAVLQVVVALCNGEGFSMASISTIIAALVAAGFIHGGQVQVKNVALKRGVILTGGKILPMLLCGAALLLCTSCATPVIVASSAGGAGGVGAAIWWLTNQNWMAKICYWVGDEAALTAMPNASRNVDADVIAFCDEGIAYLDKASGLPADQVNATLAAQLAKLPPAQVGYIQAAATILDDFLPPAAATVALTQDQINDIEGLLKGFRDGTQVCMDKLPLQVQKALAKAKEKQDGIRAKHPAGVKAAKPGGWFVPQENK